MRTHAYMAHAARGGLVALLVIAGYVPVARAQDVDWPVYLGDSGRRHYSALDQITCDNVTQLEVAWTYDAGELRAGNSTMYTSPLIVDGVLYGLSPKLIAFALNAASGEELWRHDPELTGAAQRGLMWWERDDRARLFYTAAGLIFIGATPDRKFRAYDVRNGEQLWQVELPAAAFSTPATYAVDGTQYVVIAASGGRMGPPSGSAYVAFALPS